MINKTDFQAKNIASNLDNTKTMGNCIMPHCCHNLNVYLLYKLI